MAKCLNSMADEVEAERAWLPAYAPESSFTATLLMNGTVVGLHCGISAMWASTEEKFDFKRELHYWNNL